MQTITLNLSFKTVPPIVKRNRHVLILVRTQDGHFILGTKKHYPQGMARLVGGGLDVSEDPLVAAARELNEELQLTVQPSDLQLLANIVAKIQHGGQEIEFTTWLYFYQLKLEKVTPSDDLDGIVTLTEVEYLELIECFKHLPPELHPVLGFAWSDYGQLYGPIHQIALDQYHALYRPQE